MQKILDKNKDTVDILCVFAEIKANLKSNIILALCSFLVIYLAFQFQKKSQEFLIEIPFQNKVICLNKEFKLLNASQYSENVKTLANIDTKKVFFEIYATMIKDKKFLSTMSKNDSELLQSLKIDESSGGNIIEIDGKLNLKDYEDKVLHSIVNKIADYSGELLDLKIEKEVTATLESLKSAYEESLEWKKGIQNNRLEYLNHLLTNVDLEDSKLSILKSESQSDYDRNKISIKNEIEIIKLNLKSEHFNDKELIRMSFEKKKFELYSKIKCKSSLLDLSQLSINKGPVTTKYGAKVQILLSFIICSLVILTLASIRVLFKGKLYENNDHY